MKGAPAAGQSQPSTCMGDQESKGRLLAKLSQQAFTATAKLDRPACWVCSGAQHHSAWLA